MKRTARWISVAAAGVAMSWYLGHGSTPADAQAAVTVPRPYGSIKALIDPYLVFEAADGTIRFVNITNGRMSRQISRTE